MSVLLETGASVVAVNATGRYGKSQMALMERSGTSVACIVSPGRGGTKEADRPVYDTVADAVAAHRVDAAAIYTPAAGAASSVIECARAGVRLVFVAAERMPVHDTLRALAAAREAGAWVVGPNSVGMTRAGVAALGSIPSDFTLPGSLGMIGRSGTLTMTTSRILSRMGIGQSSLTHMGGDFMTGRNPHEWLGLLLDDPKTRAVAYMGELGGQKEYAMLDLIASSSKPVFALIAGRSAPMGKTMGHAGALAGAERETAKAKAQALGEAGARVATTPYGLATLIAKELAAAEVA